MRAAVVGGTAYYAGKKVQEGREADAARDAQIADLQEEQRADRPVPAPAAQAPAEDVVSQIERLKGLLDSGALSQEEYDAAKQRVLQGG